MKKCEEMAAAWVILTVGACLLPGVITSVSPASKSVTILSACVVNRQQCRRLCGYLASCGAVWYRGDLPRGEKNCVLHSSQDVLPEAFPAWSHQEQPLANQAPSNGCSDRPCNANQVCVPSGTTSSSYRCLYLSRTDCGAPSSSSLVHGTFSYTGTFPSDTATFVCNDNYTWSSLNAHTVTCQSNGLWTSPAPDGSCQLAVFSFNPGASEFRHALPISPRTGWRACVKGNYVGPQRMTATFKASEASAEVVLQVDHRTEYNADDHLQWAVTDSSGKWSTREILKEPSPITVGSNFSLSFELQEDSLQFTYGGMSPLQIDIDKTGAAPSPDVYRATWFSFAQNVSISYISFLNLC